MHVTSLASYVPNRVSLKKLQESLGLRDSQVKLFQKVHGLDSISVEEDDNLVNLLSKSIEKMFSENDISKENIKYIIYCRTVQLVAPYPLNILLEIKKKFGLEKALAFSLTQQNCASSIMAMDVAESLLMNSNDSNELVLIITGEKAFSSIVQVIPNTTVMGEASAAFIIKKSSDKNKIINVTTKKLCEFYHTLNEDIKIGRKFQKEYVPTLVQTIQESLTEVNLSIEDISLIIPHNVNVSSWKKVAKELHFPVEKIYLNNVSRIGHCFCSDPFINYCDVEKEGIIKKDEYYLMVSVGLGAAFSVAIIKY